ncbi:MAG: 16S rRNA (adenine(1518)-N(6)/adenine(1519)-N(6))-dimethyltransferase RsmA [Clostridiales bacterium]|jgi:16S rRNA (adenine1518-N6/adenine1519-N6)-dimethyltransferase|nr:16S rRNA (adenine(1518)-N(6)/adenine(1519)-N(6))-dimethyltransferase RsmA [Clostridiales bacterium]
MDGGFRFKKSLGQNFISDTNLLNAIVSDAGITSRDVVVEIGAGAGGLSLALSKKAKKVFSFEVDGSLRETLERTLSGCGNVEVIFSDVLKMSDGEIARLVGGEFKVAANLPYYITTPLIMRFLESGLGVSDMTVMVQREVAERLTAKPGTKDYSAVTVTVDFYADAKILRNVGRNMFYPVPNVDSALIGLKIIPDKYPVKDRVKFLKFTSAAFAMRRKTFANNLNAAFGIDKPLIEKRLIESGYPPNIRGETLSMSDFLKLFGVFF